MSTNRTPDDGIIRALAAPDPRLVETSALWTSQMTWDEQGPRPARPVDQGDSDLVVSAYGTREDDDTIELVCVKGGSIDPITGAGFAFREDGDALYRGRNAPTSIQGWDTIVYTDGSGTTTGDINATKHPHMVVTSTGTAIVAFQAEIYNTGEGVVVGRFTEAAGSWSTVEVHTQSSAPTNDFHPCLYIVPRATGDRVCCLYWVEDTDTKTLQIEMQYSDDEGATWAVGSTACLPNPVLSGEDAGSRLRAAYRNGQVLLIAECINQDPSDAVISNNYFKQWGSIDNGASFLEVQMNRTANASGGSDYGGTEKSEGAYHDVVATPRGFVMANVAAQSASLAGEPYTVVRHIADAFTSYSTVPRYATTIELASTVSAEGGGYLQVALGDLGSAEIRHVPATATVASSKFTYFRGDLTIAAAEDGTLYMVTTAVNSYRTIGNVLTTTYAENEMVVTRSVDGGLTWETMGTSDILPRTVDAFGRFNPKFPGSNTLWRSQDTSSYLKDYAAAWWRGRMLVAHRWAASPGNEDDSLCVIGAGGYSTVNMPRTQIARDDTTQAGWILTWLPTELPGDLTPWAATGAATDTLQDGAVNISASSSFRKYANTDASTGYICRAALTVNSSNIIGLTRVAISLQHGDTAVDRHVEVRFTSSSIRLYDVNAGAAIGSDVSIATTQGVEVIVAMQEGTAALWYRARGLSDDSEFIAGPSGAVQNDGATGASDEIAWGVLSNDTADVDWHEFHFNVAAYAGQHIETLDGMRNPEDLSGIRYSPTGVYVTDGVSVRAVSGPAFEGDEHHIAATSDFPVARVFPTVFPSPRRGTRTVDDSTESHIAVAYDTKLPSFGWESAPLSDAMCLAVLGANWRTGHIERYDATSNSWVNVADIDTSEGLQWSANNWTVKGASLRAQGSDASATQTYLEPNELAGATLDLGSGVLRRITRNTEGSTRGTLDGRKAVITFDNADGTETTSTVRFWMPNFVVWWNMLGETAQGWRLRIPAQTTVDGDLRVGTLVWANIHAFGTEYSFGRALGQEHGVQVVEAEDRTYRTRALAPSRRSVTFSWEDGVPTCQVSGDTPDPDYVTLSTSSGALPVASAFDVPLMLRGLAEQINGPSLPVVYLPRLERGPPDATVLNRRRDFLVGVIDSDIQLDTVRGKENQSELIRVASLRVTEVV